MAKYQAYAEYKDSGVEWLGALPSHWTMNKLRYLFSFGKGLTITKENLVDEGTPCVSYGEVHSKYSFAVDPLKHHLKCVEESYLKTSPNALLQKGDFVFADTSEDLKGSGNFTHLVNDEKVFAGYHTIIARPQDQSVSRFYAYLFDSQEFRSQIQLAVKGVKVFSITQAMLRAANIWLPSKAEKQNIANFLDHETTKIDRLIEKQKQLIELLKEKRQAVISHAVTKGLDPNVPMKDSGVEWLGEVPEHWDIVQAKYIADITRGAILRPVDAPEYFDEEGEWAYLNISDATKCDKYLDESKLRLSQLGSTKSARVYPNNLIITASATIGKAFINRIKVCVHDGFIPFCNIKLDINYLYHYVSNPYLYAAMGKSNTQKNIYLDEVKNMMVTVPPRCEQVAIVKHIESSQFKYDGLIQSANSAIKLMQERRTALISAAVTGKIDVRNWQAPTLAEADTELSA